MTDAGGIQGVQDAYAAGFVAPGSTAADCNLLRPFIIDQSSQFAFSPTVFYSNQGIKLDQSNGIEDTLINGVSVGTNARGIMVVVDATPGVTYFQNRGQVWLGFTFNLSSDSGFNGTLAYPTEGKLDWPSSSLLMHHTTNGALYKRTDTNLDSGGTLGSHVLLSGVAVENHFYEFPGILSGGHFAKCEDYNENVFFIEKTTRILKKRTSGGAVSTVNVPSLNPGETLAMVRIASTYNGPLTYMLITTSPDGRVFVTTDEGANWDDLNVSNVGFASIGIRGTIAIKVSNGGDGSYSTYGPILVRPGSGVYS